MLAVLSWTPLASWGVRNIDKSFGELTGLRIETAEPIAVPYFFLLTKRLLARILILFLSIPASMSSLHFCSKVASIFLSSGASLIFLANLRVSFDWLRFMLLHRIVIV